MSQRDLKSGVIWPVCVWIGGVIAPERLQLVMRSVEVAGIQGFSALNFDSSAEEPQ